MPVNQAILDWQNALPSFGIAYSGPKDGQANQSFVDAMMTLEGKYKAYGQVFAGGNVIMSVSDAKKKFLGDSKEPAKEPTKDSKPVDQSLKAWESFLSGSLPVVGKVYDGDLAVAAKKIEAAIGKVINKPTAGIIWNDTKKEFNTTPDDVKKALDLIQAHAKTVTQPEVKAAKFTLDQRVIRMSQLLLEKK